ncbi:MAG: sigma-70 family RNA polymerase sigma factor [Flavobacteriales bacterium]|nr:sigma-70 family RNA polymerase sigma factor [Flavobacteriales bacterium]
MCVAGGLIIGSPAGTSGPMVTEALINGCIHRDAKAQYGLYRALYPVMMSICLRYQKDEQEAAATMNQGFLKILQNLKKRPDHVPFEAWARRIIINTVIDAYRRERRRREAEVDLNEGSFDDHATNGVNDYLHDMEAEALEELMNAVPPTSRNVFNLFAVDGYSHAEIADLLGISQGTSKWHVNHARQLLRKVLAERTESRALNTQAQ